MSMPSIAFLSATFRKTSSTARRCAPGWASPAPLWRDPLAAWSWAWLATSSAERLRRSCRSSAWWLAPWVKACAAKSREDGCEDGTF
ncbi:unnamed protein product [Durusdinium trenchii]|uniref:Secreted protein n=1 Tax=Durusdinium trenchii TaxID=1381693 RepID=A0ABP0JQE5_9DINO